MDSRLSYAKFLLLLVNGLVFLQKIQNVLMSKLSPMNIREHSTMKCGVQSKIMNLKLPNLNCGRGLRHVVGG